ncbi:MAG: 8-amino-7-oxononanoate synthase [Deltaproteobacteria bacterium]|nr:8-amino-7-oxononanoate synthase [Deltaproteobacteria bacterium]
MVQAWEQMLSEELSELRRRSRLRACPAFDGSRRARDVTIDGRPVKLCFSSNDYLGLSAHPALAEAARQGLATSGAGASASRLVSGDLPQHRELEFALAEFADAEACLLFPTGYQANLGVISSLAGPQDLVVSDALNHASLIDGCRLSRATVKVYPHADVSAAGLALATDTNPVGEPFRRKLLVTESVFSMDGDVAPLSQLSALCRQNHAALVVDEAHSMGVLGPGGKGLCIEQGINADVRIGTLGKAFGTAGGFVLGSRVLRDYLVNRARTFIYTTASPPSVAAAALAALNLVRGAEGDTRRLRLSARIRELHHALAITRAPTPITPIVLGADASALAASAALLARGIHVQAIRPPTVPEGTARLRVTLSADHEDEDIEALVRVLLETGGKTST